ncbi:MAG: spore coat protein, partial [Lachnospiraceae bacterium]|nr:spore coat protein [bacterium]MDY5516685.1 spore coat protein [Lachnospiraceae bacterium]
MDEKTMVSDTLTGINGELVRYGEMISQTENMQLKQ